MSKLFIALVQSGTQAFVR